jgi:hypothetical protein
MHKKKGGRKELIEEGIYFLFFFYEGRGVRFPREDQGALGRRPGSKPIEILMLKSNLLTPDS